MFDRVVAVRGGGDLGSGIALRLWRVGFRVAVLEAPRPVAVRRTVALAEAVYDGMATVEELTGRLVQDTRGAVALLSQGDVPVLVDPEAAALRALRPYCVIDAIMAKRNTGTRRDMAQFTVGLGPGFCAGVDVHAVVETNRGPHLGRVIWSGAAEPDSGQPGDIGGRSANRVLRAPGEGVLRGVRSIGDVVRNGDIVAFVGTVPVRAAFDGLVRGLARDGLQISRGMKIGDLDPRGDSRLCRLASDKALAVAGGVLEALLMNQKAEL